MNPFRFKIPRRSRVCKVCSHSLSAPAVIHSLIKGEEEEPLREDFCLACFDEKQLPSDCWGHWKIDLKEKSKPLSLDQKAMELFRDKMQDEEMGAALFLAQYLNRKKQLLLRREIKKEGYLFYEDPLTEEIYTIKKVSSSYKELLELKNTLMAELDSESHASLSPQKTDT